MEQDEIIWQNEVLEMARQVDLEDADFPFDEWEPVELIAFAKLVASAAIAKERDRNIAANELVIERVNEHIKQLHYAVQAEREECAKFFDDNDTLMFWGSQAAAHIRARGTNE